MSSILAAVQRYGFQVCQKPGVLRTRSVDLFLNQADPTAINHVSLSFEARDNFAIGEQAGTYLEVKVPMSYLEDTLYLLKNFPNKNLNLGYDLATSQVSNFGLISVS